MRKPKVWYNPNDFLIDRGGDFLLVKEKIASLRRMLGLSSAELAEKIGVTQSTISRYEKGYVRIIPHDKLVALSVVFHCTLEELLGNDPLYSMPIALRPDIPLPYGIGSK